jgi:cytochrome P450
LENQIDAIRNSKNQKADSMSIFRGILDSNLTESEKSSKRLLKDARVILAAGTDTTASAMSKMVFHLLSNPDCLEKLQQELKTAIPDIESAPTLEQVENLPYLVTEFF